MLQHYNCDILCLTETHLNDNNENSIEIKNYKWFPHSRLSKHVKASINHGGVGLLVKDEILNDFEFCIVDKSLDGLLAAKFTHKHSEFDFVIFVCYVPPEGSPWSHNVSDFYGYLSSEIYSNFECDMIFVVGDMNGRVGSKIETYSEDNIRDRVVLDKQTNSQGHAFMDCIADLRFCILNGRFPHDNFTCISHKGTSVVDYIAVPYDCIDKCKDFTVITPLDAVDDSNSRHLIGERSKISDHSLLICNFEVSNANQITSGVDIADKNSDNENHMHNGTREYPGRNRRYCFKEIPDNFCKNDVFIAALQHYIAKLESINVNQENIDTAYVELCELLISEMDLYLDMGSANRKTRKKYKSNKPFWDQELTNLWLDMKNKSKLFNKSKKSLHSKNQCYHDFKNAQHAFDRTLRRKERKYKRDQLEHLDSVCTSDPKQFWEDLNNLGSRKPSVIPDKARQADGSLSDNINDTLEIWKNDFSTLFSRPGYDKSNHEYTRLIDELRNRENSISQPDFEPENELMYDFLNEKILMLEIKKALNKLKLGKAVGLDNIPNEVLKSPSLLKLLHTFYNLCFDHGIGPSVWSKSIISPIPKSSMTDPYLPLQYRGISLLSCVYKLYASVLNSRLYSYLDVLDLTDDSQNGFRGGRSCEDHIHSLISQLKQGINAGKDSFCCYIDMQKAFDFLDRDLLLLKLLRLGISGKFYHAIKSSLLNTSSCVRINHNSSGFFNTAFGTRQGDVISPNLFSIFINDLLVELRSKKKDSDHILCNVFAYADDIVIISDSEKDLQRLINIVQNWCSIWRLEVNLSKTKVVHYRSPHKSQTKFRFTWANNNIEISDGYKYLGVYIDKHLNFNEHCENIYKSAGRALGKILSKFSYFRNVGYQTFRKIFESNVESILSYSVSTIASKKYDFDRIQSRAARYFLGVHPKTPIPALMGELGWTPFKYKRWVTMCRTWNRYINMDDRRINKQIFLNDYYSNTNTWCASFYYICYNLDLEESYNQLKEIDLNVFKDKLDTFAQDKWLESVQSKPKLRTYKTFKFKLVPEDYVLRLMSRFHRSTFAKLRCGILPLNLEVGRYRGISVENRICPLCKNGIETELHFLFECNVYERGDFLHRTKIDTNVMSNEHKLKVLMDKYQKETSVFVCNLWNQRQSKIIV